MEKSTAKPAALAIIYFASQYIAEKIAFNPNPAPTNPRFTQSGTSLVLKSVYDPIARTINARVNWIAAGNENKLNKAVSAILKCRIGPFINILNYARDKNG